jgi:hypothetical protein
MAPHQVVAGEAMNSAQNRLASVENFPLAYVKKLHRPQANYHSQHSGAVGADVPPELRHGGDLCAMPVRARRMLLHWNEHAEVRGESDWRVALQKLGGRGMQGEGEGQGRRPGTVANGALRQDMR